MESIILAVGLVCGGTAAYAVATMTGMLRRKDICPACGHKDLKMISLQRGKTWPPPKVPEDTSLHRCQTCGLEVCRAGDGPLIPKGMWDAGMRAPVAIPRVTVVRR